MTFEEFIMQARELNASDIHLTVGAPTVARINGELVKFGDLSDVVVNRTIRSILSAEQEKQLTEGSDIDFCFEIGNGARQRVNVFRQSGRLAACIRLLNDKIPTLEELKMPPSVAELAEKRRGLILVTGPTGSGKSTTLSAIINRINQSRPCHIITIEDPVEYRYTQDKATIHQREIGRDVPSFSYALRSALREDPDAAETGHLVLATLHTSSASQTIDRIIDACPVDAQEQVRAQLANMIQGVIAQNLVPTTTGTRVAALEIMLGTDAIKNLIRGNKIPQIDSTLQTSKGMCTLNDSLAKLYKRDLVSYETALEYSTDRQELEKTLQSMAGF